MKKISLILLVITTGIFGCSRNDSCDNADPIIMQLHVRLLDVNDNDLLANQTFSADDIGLDVMDQSGDRQNFDFNIAYVSEIFARIDILPQSKFSTYILSADDQEYSIDLSYKSDPNPCGEVFRIERVIVNGVEWDFDQHSVVEIPVTDPP